MAQFLLNTKINDKRDDYDFDIVNFPFLDGDVPRRTSYGVYTEFGVSTDLDGSRGALKREVFFLNTFLCFLV